jgi:glyoxylase-like metal-dependent hydrolase (beta-lactamase superfamily II)
MDLITLRLSVTNDYLFRTGDKYALVDTGYEADWELLQKRLSEAKVAIGDISHLILTHHHDDHVGCIHDLLAANPAITVVMGPETSKLIRVGKNDQTHGGGLVNRRIAFLIRFKRFVVSGKTGKAVKKEDNLLFKPYIAREGDIILSGETRLRDLGIDADGAIVPTPGHTVDSVSLLFDDGNCLVGDSAASMLLFAGTKHCVIFVMDLDQYYASWRLLLSRGAKRIWPAHGRPFAASVLEREMGRNRKEDVVSYS